jgi:hypothetical protein
VVSIFQWRVNKMDELKIRIETDEYIYEEWIIEGGV